MLGENGIVLILAIVDKATKQILSGPQIVTKGFVYVKENIDLIKEASNMSLEIIKNNTKVSYIDYGKTKNEIRDKVGNYFYEQTESKPIILIMIQEI